MSNMDNVALTIIVIDVIVGLFFVFALKETDFFIGLIGRFITEKHRRKIYNNLHNSSYRREAWELLFYYVLLLMRYFVDLFCICSQIKLTLSVIIVICGLIIFFQMLKFTYYCELIILIFMIDICWELTFIYLYAVQLSMSIFIIGAIALVLFNGAVMIKAMIAKNFFYLKNVGIFLLGYLFCKSFIEISFCIHIEGDFVKASYNVFDGLIQSVIPACVISYLATFVNNKSSKKS